MIVSRRRRGREGYERREASQTGSRKGFIPFTRCGQVRISPLLKPLEINRLTSKGGTLHGGLFDGDTYRLDNIQEYNCFAIVIRLRMYSLLNIPNEYMKDRDQESLKEGSPSVEHGAEGRVGAAAFAVKSLKADETGGSVQGGAGFLSSDWRSDGPPERKAWPRRGNGSQDACCARSGRRRCGPGSQSKRRRRRSSDSPGGVHPGLEEALTTQFP
jgi:hypothetical protein